MFMPNKQTKYHCLLGEDFLLGCSGYFSLLFYRDVAEAPPLAPHHAAEEDAESDLSDVEESGYCKRSYNAQISLRLANVRDRSVKELYHNTDKVCLYHNTYKSCNYGRIATMGIWS